MRQSVVSIRREAAAYQKRLAPISFEGICYNQSMEVMGFVTAGGRSSRMGRDKAWLELAGRPMIAHVLDALRPVVTDMAVIANRDEYAVLGVQVVADSNHGIGPIEAVRTSLAASRCDRVILAGCDLPFVTPELFSYLLGQAGRCQGGVAPGPGERAGAACAGLSRLAVATEEARG